MLHEIETVSVKNGAIMRNIFAPFFEHRLKNMKNYFNLLYMLMVGIVNDQLFSEWPFTLRIYHGECLVELLLIYL